MTWRDKVRALGPAIDQAAADDPLATELIDVISELSYSDGWALWRCPASRTALSRSAQRGACSTSGWPSPGASRGSGKPMGESDVFQRDFAVATADLSAAEAWFRATFDGLYAAAGAGGDIAARMRLAGRLSTSHAFVVATRLAQAAFASCTTHAVRNNRRIQRAFRDIQAGSAHFLTAEQSLIDAGKVLAEAEGAMLIF